MIKTIKLPGYIDEFFDLRCDIFYHKPNSSRYEMVILDRYKRATEESVDCKEEIGEIMVADGLTQFVIDVEQRFRNTEINSLVRRMRAHERSVGVKNHTDVRRVDGHENYLYVKFSPRWSHNSLAHSLYMTWFRLKISEILGHDTDTDQSHLEAAKWIIKLVKAKGLKVLGAHKHRSYTGGIVRISEAMERGCFWWVDDERCIGKRWFTPYIRMTKLFWKEFPDLKAKWDKERPKRYAF